jgi:O-antigen ligase
MASRTRSATDWRSTRSTVLTVLVAAMLSALAGLAMVKLGTTQRQLKGMLIVAAGVAMVIAATRPEIGLAMLLTLMPFEFHFSGTGTDEALIVALALVLAWRIRGSVVPAWVSLGGLALVLGSFAAAVGARDQTVALWGGVRWLAGLVVLFVAIDLFRDSRDASRRMVDIFTASAVVVVFFAYAQRAGIHTLVGAPFISDKPQSFFSYYTNYAGYVAMAAILATGEVLITLRERNWARAAKYGAALMFILSGLVISSSRGGLLALGAGWLLLLVLNARRGSIVLQAAVILAIFLGGAYIVTPHAAITSLSQRLSTPLGSKVEDKQRFAVQKAGEQGLREFPLGLGYGNAPFYLRNHVHSVYVKQAFSHAQETFVQIGLDAGWLGLAGFLLLFLSPMGLVLKHGERGSSAVRASAFAAALGAFLAQGLYDYLFYDISFIVFVLAMVWGTIHALSIDEEASALPEIEVGSAAPLLGRG